MVQPADAADGLARGRAQPIRPRAAVHGSAFGPTVELKERLPFAIGGHGFLKGDSIQVTEFLGDRPKIEAGGTYLVRGTYSLAPIDAAQISA
jgi:hypothetical protein